MARRAGLVQIGAEAHAVIFEILVGFGDVGAHRKLRAVEIVVLLRGAAPVLLVLLAVKRDGVRRVAPQEVF